VQSAKCKIIENAKRIALGEFKVKNAKCKFDDPVKSLKRRISVIPAKAGIQSFQILKNSLDSGLRRAQPSRFHRSDDFLRDHQFRSVPILNFDFCNFHFAICNALTMFIDLELWRKL